MTRAEWWTWQKVIEIAGVPQHARFVGGIVKARVASFRQPRYSAQIDSLRRVWCGSGLDSDRADLVSYG